MDERKEHRHLIRSLEEYFYDSPEQIQKCLNCDKPECNDCVGKRHG